MNKRMTLTVHNRRLFAQHARPSDAALPFANTATKAADLLCGNVARVQMAYDIVVGREVKQLLRTAKVIS